MPHAIWGALQNLFIDEMIEQVGHYFHFIHVQGLPGISTCFQSGESKEFPGHFKGFLLKFHSIIPTPLSSKQISVTYNYLSTLRQTKVLVMHTR